MDEPSIYMRTKPLPHSLRTRLWLSGLGRYVGDGEIGWQLRLASCQLKVDNDARLEVVGHPQHSAVLRACWLHTLHSWRDPCQLFQC